MFKVLTRDEAQDILKSKSHYVYGLCRGDTDSVFYVGKGFNGRIFEHEKLKNEDNQHKNRIIRKHGISGYVFFRFLEDAKLDFYI